MSATTRTVRTGDIDLHRTLRPLAFFPSDPTAELGPDRFARASPTPDGPATVEITWRAGRADVTIWGQGAAWIDDHLPSLLGLTDDPRGFEPHDPIVRHLWARFGDLRIMASHTLWHDVVWLVPGQRVATVDAARQWGRLTRRLGEPAPGPLDLWLPPTSERLAATHYTELHPCGIERRRAETLRAAARAVPRLERRLDLGLDELSRRIEAVPGLGPWTSTNVAAMTLGDPDTVVLGDYGLPSFVTWALARQRVGTDEDMLELLEPYRPHRWRVCRFIMASSIRPPRHGPRHRSLRIDRL